MSGQQKTAAQQAGDGTADAATGDLFGNWIGAGAALFRTAHPDRAAAWKRRLEMNAPEIELLRSLPVAGQPQVLPTVPPAALNPAARLAATGLEGQGGADAVAAAQTRMREIAALNYVTHEIADNPEGGPSEGKGWLAGVPFAVKDLTAVAGAPLSDGSAGQRWPEQDAKVIANLRAAGAVPVAMANLHELAFGITGDNIHHGNAGHPSDADRITGGSSSGSAGLVAAGAVPFAVGTDTAGSIRIPAALCGCVGFKPSYGLLSREGGTPLAWSLDHLGPLAMDVAGAAAATFAMAGLEPEVVSNPDDGASGPLRLLRPTSFFFDVIEPSAAEAIEAALAALAAAGIEIGSTDISETRFAAAAQFATIAPEAFEANRHRLEAAPENLSEDVRVRLEIGQFMRSVDYVRAQRFRGLLSQRFHEAMEGGALLVTPSVPLGAPRRGATMVHAAGRDWPIHTLITRCTAPFNLTGMPAISLPCGMDAEGMPVALQLVAPYGEDGRLLRAAAMVEAVLAGHLAA